MTDINSAMQLMPPEWRTRWCTNQACACVGCANKSGGLTSKGFTKEDHQKWLFAQKNK